MNTYKIGVIRVLTTDNPDLLQLHGKLLEAYYPGLHTVSYCIPDQPQGIYNDDTLALGVPKVIALGEEIAGSVDAIIVSCAGDPGVADLRKSVDIPVIGAGEATAFLATHYGDVFGVLGIMDEPPPAYKKYFKKIVGKHRPPSVHTTLDLMTPQGKNAIFDTALEIKDLGANVIAMSCTGIGPLQITGELQSRCQIPVIDPIQAEGLMAYYECLRQV